MRRIQDAAADADLLVTAGDDHALTQCAAQKAQRLAERSPGVIVVQIGPEQRDDLVTAAKCRCLGECEVCEQRQPLRLRQHGTHVHAGRVPQIHTTECAQMDHGPAKSRRNNDGVTRDA